MRTPPSMNHLASVTASRAPALITTAGARASYRFLEFFTAQIRNPHTRRAYARAAAEFFDWLEAKGVTQLTAIESVHTATYIEELSARDPRRPRSCAWPRCVTCSTGW
jgi:site-specific recombinase XerD